jgi:outer membrane protein assembly factor BamB
MLPLVVTDDTGRRARCRLLRRALALPVLACLLAACAPAPARAEPSWPTYHRDAGRSGLDPDVSEPIAPVQAWQSPSLGAPIWSQPLVLGSRVYVATVGDVVYALDAATGAVAWEKKLGTPVPSGELPCGDISPTVGIVGTPVIDPAGGTIYAVADTWDASKKEAHHELVGLSLATGAEVLRMAVDPPGADAKALLQRTALNLDEGDVVFGFGGNDGDCGEYRGTVVAAPEIGGSPSYWRYQPATPSKSGGAVWAPAGAAVDGQGNIYFATGNPNPPSGQKATTYDYSDSLIELSPALSQIGSFEPPTWESDSNSDNDLGSAGPELLPGGVLFQAGKNGTGYLINEATMGSAASALYSAQVCGGRGSFGGDAYAGGVIYIPCTTGVQALSYNQTAHTFTPLWRGPADAFGPPIVSGGLVWVIATGGFSGGGTKLYGIVPSSGATRYTEILPSPMADHFGSPSAAGGRLYVSTGKTVTAFQVGTSSEGPGTETPASTQPQGGQTSSSAQATAQAQAQATSPSPSPRAVALLVHTHLHASPSGRVRLTLWCAPTACAGAVRVVARRRLAGRGPDHPPRMIKITVAQGRFGPATGKLTVTLSLDRWARIQLRGRRHRLSVAVVINSPGAGARATAATLTENAP